MTTEILKELTKAVDMLRSEVIQLKTKIISGSYSRSFSDAIYVGNGTVLIQLRDGHLMYVDTRSLDIGIHLLRIGVWETEYVNFFRSLINPGDCVLDVGANHGVYTLAAARAVGPGGHVFAFEANPRFFELTQMSIAANGYRQRATIFGYAVGNIQGFAELEFDTNFSGGGSMLKRTFKSARDAYRDKIVVNVEKIDDLIGDKIERVDVVKMDVEGCEGSVLQGMEAILARSPNVRLILEWGCEMLRASSVKPQQITDYFKSLGMSAWLFKEKSSLLPIDWDDLAVRDMPLQNIYVSRNLPE